MYCICHFTVKIASKIYHEIKTMTWPRTSTTITLWGSMDCARLGFCRSSRLLGPECNFFSHRRQTSPYQTQRKTDLYEHRFSKLPSRGWFWAPHWTPCCLKICITSKQVSYFVYVSHLMERKMIYVKIQKDNLRFKRRKKNNANWIEISSFITVICNFVRLLFIAAFPKSSLT